MEREKVVFLLGAGRRFAYKTLVVVALSGAVSFVYAKDLLRLLLKAAGVKIYCLGLPEVFLSSVELSIYAGAFFAVPFAAFLAWHEFHGMTGLKRLQGYTFVLAAILLFYGGSLFCYSVVLPSGIGFLVDFGKGNKIMAMISMERFVGFCSAMIFACSMAFEIPIVLLLLSKMGLVRAKALSKTRRYAILFIAVASALITPTPDVYNMALVGVPMYILYEVGILLVRINEPKDRSTK
ncbi:twin-arginine translocase subunit TatC [Syntrophorhabdus aromaticivorans]|jgi:sec-independent protein translocase protein TatC|uniref:Sec-independent protein translocase protein TatC n=1 Tax=Syntrophorhabdus aromaticivorans TaxID=328301 RepID=A0A971S2A7_9BACT|nr:twin-arginine translocase subunit TatC [Syntrophorhabdus aromaticivorans]NLW36454.1 preprotein translocase subunit TatC [Syntrophorhabdus aromaticivorans]